MRALLRAAWSGWNKRWVWSRRVTYSVDENVAAAAAAGLWGRTPAVRQRLNLRHKHKVDRDQYGGRWWWWGVGQWLLEWPQNSATSSSNSRYEQELLENMEESEHERTLFGIIHKVHWSFHKMWKVFLCCGQQCFDCKTNAGFDLMRDLWCMSIVNYSWSVFTQKVPARPDTGTHSHLSF